jgi:hypothetical protein
MSEEIDTLRNSILQTHAQGAGFHYMLSFRSKKTNRFVIPKGYSSALLSIMRRTCGYMYKSRKDSCQTIDSERAQERHNLTFINLTNARETNYRSVVESFPLKSRIVYNYSSFYGYASSADTELASTFKARIENLKLHLQELEAEASFPYKINLAAFTNKGYFTSAGNPHVQSSMLTSLVYSVPNPETKTAIGFIPILGINSFSGKEITKIITL